MTELAQEDNKCTQKRKHANICPCIDKYKIIIIIIIIIIPRGRYEYSHPGLHWTFNPLKQKLFYITFDFSPYLKENTTLHYYKDQLVNAVKGSNRCL
jgi:hypothetical protein